MKQILYYKLKACLKRYVFTRHLKLTESQGWIWEKKLKSTSSLHKIRYLTKEVLKFSSYEVYRKFIISERRGTICSLRGRLKKGRGRGRGRGWGTKTPKSPTLSLPWSSSPFPFLPIVCIKKKTFYKKCRIGLWLVLSFLPSISCQSIPQKGAHKNSRGLFIEQKYVITFYNARWRKYRELTLHQQKYRDTHTSLEKKEPARSFHSRNTSQKKRQRKVNVNLHTLT